MPEPAPARRDGLAAWAWIAAGLYLLTLLALAPSVVLWLIADHPVRDLDDAARLYGAWGTWALLGGFGVVQGIFLLLVPVPVARRQPVTRRRWWPLAAIAGLLSGLLVLGLGIALLEALTVGESAGDWVSQFVLALAGVSWLVWTVVFGVYRFAGNEAAALRRVLDHLLAGSVAELLVAVPCHVYVRGKDYCCAGFGTFFGLCTGIAVMLFSFGPGVFFLFAERARRLRGDAAPPTEPALDAQERDAVRWAAGSLLCLIAAALWSLVDAGQAPAQALTLQIAAVVTAGAAAVDAARAWRRTRRFGRPLLAVLLLAGECVVIAGWWAVAGV